MSNRATLKTKGGYYVWLVTGCALQQSDSPHPKTHTHYRLTCQFLCVLMLHNVTRGGNTSILITRANGYFKIVVIFLEGLKPTRSG